MKTNVAHDAGPVPAHRLPEPPVRVRVLYIGGCGRSGSTLLDRMLGQVPGVCSLGELTQLWKALLHDAECGCGVPIRRCLFWRAVGECAFGGWDAVDVGEMLQLQRAVLRQRYVPFMVAPESWPPYRRKLERYTRLLGEVYRGVQEVSGAALVVDSTKHYAGAFLLRRMAGVDLRVVHLVRDSRGVAFSWSKRVPRPEAMHRGSHMNRYGAGRSAGRWLGYNSGFEVLERLGIPSTFVRYEDLVRAPRPELARILERAGVLPTASALSFVRGHEVALRPNHTVAGNPMRFRVGTIRLTVDDAWRSNLPSAHRRIVSLLTRPLLVRYGYAGERGGAAGLGVRRYA